MIQRATLSRPDDLPWYAIQIQARLGSIASVTLRGKGYEEFLPLYRSRRRWSDRMKELELPLFPGYLFCRFDVSDRLMPILTTPGVIGIVGAGSTNVLVAALRSRRGASFRLLDLLGDLRWQANLSVALALEYEQVAKRKCVQGEVTEQIIDDILDRLLFRCRRRPVFCRWRPFLPDPKDDFVLEVAVESRCDFIITFNTKDFAGAEQFGIVAVTPKEFLMKIGEHV